jgi:hypothetical protein
MEALNVFCHQDETIKYIFFQHKFSRLIWPTIQAAFTLYPPCSVANIFGSWLYGIDTRFKIIVMAGALVITLSLWLCRNDKVFNDKNLSFMQVIYRCTTLSSLQRVKNRDLIMELSSRLEDTPFFPTCMAV